MSEGLSNFSRRKQTALRSTGRNVAGRQAMLLNGSRALMPKMSLNIISSFMASVLNKESDLRNYAGRYYYYFGTDGFVFGVAAMIRSEIIA
jgi:hypothetical protein